MFDRRWDGGGRDPATCAYDTQAMWIRFATFAVWLGVGASAVYWVMPWVGPESKQQQPAVPVAVQQAVAPADWSPLLSRAAPVSDGAPALPESARFRLVGVAGPLRASGQGVALLSIDGQAPRAFKPGERVDGSRVILEVSAHTVKIGVPGGPPSLTLQAPLMPPPATGVPAPAAPASAS